MTIDKDKVRGALLRYIERYPSQNKAAASLKGVSAATVSLIVNGKFNLISTNMWENISSQVQVLVKKCPKCGRELDATCFYKNKKKSDGLCFYCKDCMNVYERRKREKKTNFGLSEIPSVLLLKELKRRGYTWDYVVEPKKVISFNDV